MFAGTTDCANKERRGTERPIRQISKMEMSFPVFLEKRVMINPKESKSRNRAHPTLASVRPREAGVPKDLVSFSMKKGRSPLRAWKKNREDQHNKEERGGPEDEFRRQELAFEMKYGGKGEAVFLGVMGDEGKEGGETGSRDLYLRGGGGFPHYLKGERVNKSL